MTTKERLLALADEIGGKWDIADWAKELTEIAASLADGGGDAKDAARYRYLRDHEITREVDDCLQYAWQCEFRLNRKNESLDQTIDAALAAAQQGSGGGA